MGAGAEEGAMDEKFMRRALELAKAALDEDGAVPYAAVVVKDGRIVGEGLNRAVARSDPTSHGEVEAIRDACRRLGTPDLSGCDLYTTAEPCAMCVATIHLAHVERLYYAISGPDNAPVLAEIGRRDPRWARRISGSELRREVGLPVEQRAMPAGQLLAGEAKALLDAFLARKTGGPKA